MKPDTSFVTKSGHFHLLTTPDDSPPFSEKTAPFGPWVRPRKSIWRMRLFAGAWFVAFQQVASSMGQNTESVWIRRLAISGGNGMT